jgi:hypothetical protein
MGWLALNIVGWVAATCGAAVLIHFVAEWVRRQWRAWRRREDQHLPKTLPEHHEHQRRVELNRQIALRRQAELAREQAFDRRTERA